MDATQQEPVQPNEGNANRQPSRRSALGRAIDIGGTVALLGTVGGYVAYNWDTLTAPKPPPLTESGEKKLFDGRALLRVNTTEGAGNTMRITGGELIITEPGIVTIEFFKPTGSGQFQSVNSSTSKILQICRGQEKGTEYKVKLPTWAVNEVPSNVAMSVEFRPDNKAATGGTEVIRLGDFLTSEKPTD